MFCDVNDIETKFQGVKILPTYEESLRDYSSLLNTKKPDKTILDKDKKDDKTTDDKKDEN